MKSFTVFFIAALCALTGVYARQQDKHLVEDSRMVREYFQSVQGIFSPDSLMVKAALLFLNTPYVAHTLEGNEEEQLVINLREMDCMTFVENCLALSRAAQYPHPDYDYFVRQLKEIRYRAGILDGYTSRLHYTTDWISDNVGKGTVEDISYALGGKRFQPRVNYMSSHPELYPALRNHPQDVAVMTGIERTINQRTTYYFIPKDEIKSKQSLIKSGDIVCFTTSLPGLDISHVGIAYRNKGQLSFIHASTKQKKVVINPESLADYCGMIRTNTGIMVLRMGQGSYIRRTP